MKTKQRKTIAYLWKLCPFRHGLLLLSLALVIAHLLTRNNHALNQALSVKLVRPLHGRLADLCAGLPFSVAELLIGLAAFGVLAFTLCTLYGLLRRPERGRRLYRYGITLLSGGMAVYAGFCLLWGVYYYGDDFLSTSGLRCEAVSVEQLETVTAYFARLADCYGEQIDRDAQGRDAADRSRILVQSPQVYKKAEELFPSLQGPTVAAKGIFFSRVMSLADFTGFFFPFTAEANVNMDFPQALLASTVAHELAHQRGVAQEQEANFVAVLASLEYGDPEYAYSACLMAYIYLSNALYSVDRAAWQQIATELSNGVCADLQASNEYWAQFATPVRTVSNTVYEGFLQSYDQDLGLRSYGACVDLLVNYYSDAAEGFLTSAQ